MEWLIKLNDQLMNAPAGVVVGLFAIALGYVLKASSLFPNNRIPFVIVLFTATAFPTVQFCANKIASVEHAGLRVPLHVLIGFIIGFVAWTLHAQILRRFVDPKFFKNNTPQNQIPPTPT